MHVLSVVVAALIVVTSFGAIATTSQVTAISCNECQDIVSIVYGIADSPIALNTTVEVLVEICDAKFANDTKLKDDCVLLMKLGGDLLPLIFKGLNDLAWNIPLTFCADVAKVCVEPCCTAGAPPQEVFINFADSSDLSQIRATWITLNDTEGAGVEWWVSGGSAAPQTAKEATRTYTAGGWIGVIHSALMTGLLPDTQYSYRVGSSWHGWSANLTFRTLPTVIGVPSRPLRVLQLADMGYAKFSNATVAQIESYVTSGKVDFIIHNGDISYADADEQHWDLFFNKIQPIASRVPYMTTPGNHELYWNFTAYQARLAMSMPTPVPAAGSGAMYYGLTVGPLQFAFLDSESWIDTGNLDPAQLSWLKALVGGVDRNTTPIVTVAQHRPLYCCECGDILSDILRLQSEDVINDLHIDLHLSGHQHNYQRAYPVRNGELVSTNYTNPTTPVYIVNGAAGNREGQDGFHANQPYLANGSKEYGFSYITYSVDAATSTATVVFEFIESETGAVSDTFTLIKNY